MCAHCERGDEITPEMIEAGTDAYWDFLPDEGSPVEVMIREVFLAMSK